MQPMDRNKRRHAGHALQPCDVQKCPCGSSEPASYLTPMLEIMQRAAADHKIKRSVPEPGVVIVKLCVRQQLSSKLAQTGNIITVVVNLDLGKQRSAVEIVVSDSATPVQDGETVFVSGCPCEYISVGHHDIVIGSIFTGHAPRKMRHAQWPRPL